MAAKLKSVLRRIHWSLALKAVLFYAAWIFFPFWAAAVLAVVLYLAPFFKPRQFLVPFLLLLLLAYFLPSNFWNGAALAGGMYLILGIKDLVFVNRRVAYQTLAYLLFLPTYLHLFATLKNWQNAAFIYLFLTGLIFLIVIRAFLNYSFPLSDAAEIRKRWAIAGASALLIWQLSITLLFLPFSFWSQAAILFLAAAILLQNILDDAAGILERKKLIFRLVLFLGALAIVLLGNGWGL